MKVIMKSDVENVGRAGDIKQVALGFARNFLIPRGLAMEATAQAVKWFETNSSRRQQLREKAAGAAQETAAKLTGVSLSFTRQVGQNGKLFGSVGKSDIIDSLKASGFSVDKTQLVLPAAIKEVGDFEVEVKLQSEVSSKVKVSVVARG